MNHLEPLAWAAGAPTAPLIAHGQDAFVFDDPLANDNPAPAGLPLLRSTLSMRSIFRLVAVFLRGAEQPAMPTSQAATAYAALELACLEFALVARQPWSTTHFRSECARCVVELEALVSALSGGEELPPRELIHAFDTLIALLVQIDAANRASEG